MVTTHRGSKVQNIEQQFDDNDQVQRLVNALSVLNPNGDRKDRITYCRITGREYVDDKRTMYTKSNLSQARRHKGVDAQPGG